MVWNLGWGLDGESDRTPTAAVGEDESGGREEGTPQERAEGMLGRRGEGKTVGSW